MAGLASSWAGVACCIPAGAAPRVAPAHRGFGAPADEVQAFSQDSARTGHAVAPGLTPGLTQQWAADFGGGSTVSPPLVAGGRVFVMTARPTQETRVLAALDEASGAILWSRVVASSLVNVNPMTFDAGRLFVEEVPLTGPGMLEAVDPATGAAIWDTPICVPTTYGPVTFNGVVYTATGCPDGTRGMRESDGTVTWHGDGRGGEVSVDSSGVYVAYAGQLIAAYDLLSGALKWKGGNGPWTSVPSLWQGRVYATSIGNDSGLVLDQGSGVPVGAFSSWIYPAFAGSTAYVLGSGSLASLRAEDTTTGTIRWIFRGDGHLDQAPVFANGIVYVMAGTGALYALAADTGAAVWRVNLLLSSSAAAGSVRMTASGSRLFLNIGSQLVVLGSAGQPGPAGFQGGTPLPGPAPCGTTAAGTLQPGEARDWRMDPGHTGWQQSEATMAPPLQRQWSATYEGPVSYPVVAGGRVFVDIGFDTPGATSPPRGPGAVLEALDQATGCLLWGPIDQPSFQARANSTYDNATLFSSDGVLLRALDPANGHLKWASYLGAQALDPVASGGKLYADQMVGTGVTAQNQSDGSLAWIGTPQETFYLTSAAVGPSGVYHTFQYSTVTDFNPADGTKTWELQVGADNMPRRAPTLAGNSLYVANSVNGHHTIFDASNGATLGQYDADQAPAVDATQTYLVGGGNLRAVLEPAGSVQWTYAGTATAPVVANGHVYVANGSQVVAVNALTGAQEWTDTLADTVPTPDPAENQFASPETGLAVAGGMLFVPASHSLYAYGASAPVPLPLTVPPPPLPGIISVGPLGGTTAGGIPVTIDGTGFFGGTTSCQVSAVGFGGAEADTGTTTACTDTSLTIVAPPGAAGLSDVTVTTPGGTSGANPGDQFTYVNPSSIVTSTLQYQLTNSDGQTWRDIDPGRLWLPVMPYSDSTAVLMGNADLWTATRGYNQDIAVFASENSGPDQLVAWKESGGFGGTYSPNAAAVQAWFPMTAGRQYLFKLKWKTNRNAPNASIFAGAGPINGQFSPTSLSATVVDPASFLTTRSLRQYNLRGSDGATWRPVDPASLAMTLTPPSNQDVVLTANADLWTANPGINQDLAIFATDNGGPEQVLAWKESGGRAGTFSPNAAMIRATFPLAAGHTYQFWLKWKSNKPAPGATIYAGAGPTAGQFSPTSLTAQGVSSTTSTAAVGTLQYHLAGSDGNTWQPMEATNLAIHLAPLRGTTAVLGANADLWTASTGYNQDLGIFVSDNSGPWTLVGWKESGGFAGTFSPNAAYVQAMFPMTAGHTYDFRLEWKANRFSPGVIYSGAGPITGQFSPTRLTAEISG